jgi:peptidoglycan/LPS O-acetylase OafA/YrhL
MLVNRYRLEIDGLRAFAVLPVIFYHAGFDFFSGGFVGVDVFFVISGYLITSLIVQQTKEGNFSLLDFYERRARRILPALFLVMFCSIPLAYFLMKPNQLEAFSGSLIAATLFFSNILFYAESDYFGIASELKPLLHTWSLAVEEQYYLFFPLLVLLVGRGKLLLSLICAGILLSFSLSQFGGNLSLVYPFMEKEWLWVDVPNWAFFNTPTRIWEIMMGALIGLYLIEKDQFKGIIGELSGLLGLCLISVSIFAFEKSTPHPSIYTLAPVLGTTLIILGASPNTFVGKILSAKIFVAVGLISYSAYLWHYPLFAFSKIAMVSDEKPGILNNEIILIMAAFVLAYLSFNFIEKPFRDRKKITSKQVAIVLFCAAAILVMVGIIGKSTSGFKNQYYAEILPENRFLIIDREQLNEQRMSFWSISRKNQMAKRFDTDGRDKILIVGDSHSQDLATAFETNSDLFYTDFQVRRLTLLETCFAQIGSVETGGLQVGTCNRMISEYQNSSLPNDANYIFLSARWSEGSVEYLADFHNWLGDNANKVIFFDRTAEYSDTADVAMLLAKQNKKVIPEVANKFLSKYRNVKLDSLNQELNLVVKNLGWPIVDRLSLGCSSDGDQCDFFSSDGLSYYSDYGHWTVAGSKLFGQKLFDAGFGESIKEPDFVLFSIKSKVSE